MRFAEIIQELTVGSTRSTGVSTIDRTAPWVKKGMEKAGERTKTMRANTDASEKFNYLYKETNGFTTKQQIRLSLTAKGKRVTLVSYDPTAQEIIVDANAGQQRSQGTHYKFDVQDIEYLGREKSVSTPGAKYKFNFSAEPKEVIEKENPTVQQRRGPKKPTEPKFKNDVLKRAHNPFG